MHHAARASQQQPARCARYLLSAPLRAANSYIVRAGDDGVCAIFVGRDYNENMLNRFAVAQRTQRVLQHRCAGNFDVL